MKLTTQYALSAALALAAGCLLAPPGQAQETVEASSIEEIVVTGSRIRRDGFQYSAPVEIIGDERLDNIGATNVGDFLQTIPQSIGAINNANAAFSVSLSGQNLTSLRNLGTSSTADASCPA